MLAEKYLTLKEKALSFVFTKKEFMHISFLQRNIMSTFLSLQRMFFGRLDTRISKSEGMSGQNKKSVGLWESVSFARMVMLILQQAFFTSSFVVDKRFYQHYINKYVSNCI